MNESQILALIVELRRNQIESQAEFERNQRDQANKGNQAEYRREQVEYRINQAEIRRKRMIN